VFGLFSPPNFAVVAASVNDGISFNVALLFPGPPMH